MFKYKVILVDDEPIILDGLTEIFLNEFDNIEIVGKYKDGIAAIEHLKKQTADFVITDINMPKANGLDILKYIRESNLETKCVLITGYEQFEYAVQAIDYGADALLQKPINLKKMISVINSLFEKNSSHINSIMEKTQYYLDRRNLSRDSLLLYSNNQIPFDKLCQRLSRNNENKLNYNEAQCLYLKFSWEERENFNPAFFRDALEIANDELDIYVINENSVGAYVLGISQNTKHLEEVLKENARMLQLIDGMEISQEVLYKGSLKNFNTIDFNSIVDFYFESVVTMQPMVLDRLRKIIIDDFDIKNTKKIIFQLIKKAESYANVGEILANFEMLQTKQQAEELLIKFEEKISDKNPEQTVKLNVILRYLTENCENDFSLVSVADKFGISPTYLSKIIKKETGKGFAETVFDIKMSKAKKLLVSGKEIKEVSELVGYSSAKYFSKVFKERNGISPKEYKILKMQEE